MPQKPHTGKLLWEILGCVIIPTIILKKLSGAEQLGAVTALLVALSLPCAFAIYEIVTNKKIALVPSLGFISIMLTGGIGLFELPTEYIAYKEALIPFVLGVATLFSAYTSRPLARTFFYNDTFLNITKIHQALVNNDAIAAFDKIMQKATLLVSTSFLLSTVINFFLARLIVTSPSGSAEFNDQLGTMTLWSYPIIVLPCMIITGYSLYFILIKIKDLSGLELENIINH